MERELRQTAAGGFRQVTFRGDTDFTQTKQLDRWDEQGIGFLFGADAHLNVRLEAELLENEDWQRLERPPKYTVSTFCNAFLQLPCQIVQSGRPLIYRLLSRNRWQHVFFRLVERLHGYQMG